MDSREGLTPDAASVAEAEEPPCPDCSAPPSLLPAIRTFLLGDVELKRCARCGCRYPLGPAQGGALSRCTVCGLPCVAVLQSAGEAPRCDACRGEGETTSRPGTPLAEATEHEIRSALESRWRFLDSPSSSVYFDKVLRALARRMEGAPASCRVAIFDDKALRTLALPSGTLLLSQGTMDELDDEAQLAFVLAHDLAHVAAGDAASATLRLGMGAMAREDLAHQNEAWGDASEDLVRLGHGRAREVVADERALDVVLGAGYDPGSVVRYLQHLELLEDRGDARVAELALAHPPPRDRLMRLERQLSVRATSGAGGRVNREVFRRAAGRHAETVEETALSGLLLRDGDRGKREGDAEVGGSPGGVPRWLYALILAALAALVLALAGLFRP